MRRATIIGLCLAVPDLASAGAWPRPEGEVFLSLGGNVALIGDGERPIHYDPTIYAEYGATPLTTLGIDGHTSDRGEIGTFFVFARHTLQDDADPVAVSLGLGLTGTLEVETDPVLRFGLHVGDGFDGGWIALDASVTRGISSSFGQEKLDFTYGRQLSDTLAATLEAHAGTGLDGGTYAKVSSSVIWSATDRVDLRGGYVQGLTGDNGGGISLQAWTTF